MPIDVKICGVSDATALDAAVGGGARFVGFVFFAKSPRALTPAMAAGLLASVPPGVLRVGLVVDATDTDLADLLAALPLDFLQLHGREPLARVADIRSRFQLPVIKAIAVGSSDDVAAAAPYADVADRLLFDARPPAGASRPGGNAQPFDWRLLAGRPWNVPWLLAGGLNAGNVAEAVRLSGATAVDVSSGVEDAPGHKNASMIRAFLAEAAQIEPPKGAGPVAQGVPAAHI